MKREAGGRISRRVARARRNLSRWNASPRESPPRESHKRRERTNSGSWDIPSFRQGSRIKARANEKATKDGAEEGSGEGGERERGEKSGDIMYRVRAIRLLKTVVARCE